MVYSTNTKNALASYYGSTLSKYIGALTALGSSGGTGTEVTGGSYARVAASWGSASGGSITSSSASLNIPAGTTIVGVALYDVSTGTPTYYDQSAVTSQTFSSSGTYSITATYSQV